MSTQSVRESEPQMPARDATDELMDQLDLEGSETRAALEQITRAEIGVGASIAKKYPRKLQEFYDRAKAMITTWEVADECIYSVEAGYENGRKKFVEGPSIRLAEIVAASYGNLRTTSIVVEMTPEFVKARATAHDMETGNYNAVEWPESTLKKDGTPYSQRQRIKIGQVAQAKALRDAIFHVIPRAVCRPIIDHCEAVYAKTAPPFSERVAAVMEWLKTLPGTTPTKALASIGCSGSADLTEAHLRTLSSLRSAIRANELTVAQAFSDDATAATAPVNRADALLDRARRNVGIEAPVPPAQKTAEPSQPSQPVSPFDDAACDECGAVIPAGQECSQPHGRFCSQRCAEKAL